MNNTDILKKAEIIYDYLNINTEVLKADIIIGLGCMDTSIPKECAKLYKNGYGKFIVFTGNKGKGTQGVLEVTEAKHFKNIAINLGVPEDKILLEEEATNTYENYKFTKKLLKLNNYDYDSVIIVQKPYVKRRCLAIADIELQYKKFYVTSEDLNFDEFILQSEKNKTMTIDEIINEIVGEVSIILETPKFGIQSEQKISSDILDAYYYLLNKGYNKHVITREKIEMVIQKWLELGIIDENLKIMK